MLPYDALHTLSRPSVHVDVRTPDDKASTIDGLVSRAAYRLTSKVDRLLFRRGR